MAKAISGHSVPKSAMAMASGHIHGAVLSVHVFNRKVGTIATFVPGSRKVLNALNQDILLMVLFLPVPCFRA